MLNINLAVISFVQKADQAAEMFAILELGYFLILKPHVDCLHMKGVFFQS